MAKKLNSMPDYQARMPKQPHDVSQSTALTAVPGMLLPVYYDMLHLGDEIHFDARLFARMNPLVVASLATIDVHVDHFFVPLTVMYTPSSSMFYQTDDLVSSLFRPSTGSGGQSSSATNQFEKFPVLQDLQQWATEDYIPSNGVPAGFSNTIFDVKYFDCQGKNYYRSFDLFDWEPDYLLDTSQWENKRTSTPWFFCAYQAAYQLYYRNDDREPKNYHYNFDNAWSSGLISASVGIGGKPLWALNYVSRPKDYFNSVKVSPISSSVSILNGSDSLKLFSSVNNWLNSFSNSSSLYASGSNGIYLNSSSSQNGSLLTQATATSLTSAAGGTSAITTSSIRQLFMFEKLARVIGRADKNYESQFLAHYGIKIPHDVMHNITHIGHDMVTFTPEPVVSTADTFDGSMGSSLGEIGGQGQVSLKGKKRSFKAPFHGVFMSILYFVPRVRYEIGFNKLHDLSSPASFWQPEYDRKGMQPLFLYEAQGGVGTPSTTRLGWQFAYEQFKRKADRVSAAFRTPIQTGSGDTVNTYSPWVMSVNPYGYLSSTGAQSPVPSTLTFASLLCSPNDMNSIMQVPHNTLWSQDYIEAGGSSLFQTDPFICDFRLNCKKVNAMSEYGEPEL